MRQRVKESLCYIRPKKQKNKCFSGHIFEKQMRQAAVRFLFLFFISQKTDDATFFLFHQNLMRHILSIKNIDILILTSE